MQVKFLCSRGAVQDTVVAIIVASGGSMLAFVFSLLKGLGLSADLASISAVDMAVFAFCVILFLQSVIGLISSNDALLRSQKSGSRFWEGDILEYFYKENSVKFEAWRIARGRYILYGVFSAFSLSFLYLYMSIRAQQ